MGNGIDIEIGHALRRIRLARGMRLLDLRDASGGRFSPTTVAGYERGEREISLHRFCELCEIYHVRPELILARIMRAARGRDEIAVDLRKIRELPTEGRSVLEAFVRRLTVDRGTPAANVLIIRTADIEVLATAVDTPADELLAEIGADPHDVPAGTETPPSGRP